MKIYPYIINVICQIILSGGPISGQLRSPTVIFQGKAAELCQDRGVVVTKPSLSFLNLSNVIPPAVQRATTVVKDGGQQKAMIFHGAPGMGKNYTTEAMAGELDAYLLSCDVPKMAKKFVGSGTDLTDAVKVMDH